MIIPVKLAAEAAFLALFNVIDREAEVFERYMKDEEGGAKLAPQMRRSVQDWFKRVGLRLGAQARERRDAEGGEGSLGLMGDEADDEKEIWSVGRVEVEGTGTAGE